MEEKYNKVLGIFDELDDTSKCPIMILTLSINWISKDS
jgi:hypothetical protein